MRDSFRGEHHVASITERWQTVDDYFECITECDLEDQTCVTMCIVKHLSEETQEVR